jgi:hypothetical protein
MWWEEDLPVPSSQLAIQTVKFEFYHLGGGDGGGGDGGGDGSSDVCGGDKSGGNGGGGDCDSSSGGCVWRWW